MNSAEWSRSPRPPRPPTGPAARPPPGTTGSGAPAASAASQHDARVLAVQSGAEAGLERAVEHPLAVHLEDLRCRRTRRAAPRAPSRRSTPAARASTSASATASIVAATTSWLHALRDLAGARSDRRARSSLPIASKIGVARANAPLGAADHDRERPVDRAHLAAANRRVEHRRRRVAAEPLRERARRTGIDRAHVDDQRPGAAPPEHAVGTEHHLLDVGRVGQHRDDDVAARARRPPATPARAAPAPTSSSTGAGLRECTVSGKPGGKEVPRHGRAHDARAR